MESGAGGPKKMLYVGGLAEEVDQKVLQAAFIPFGDIVEVNMPVDYETEKHRGFAFIEFESSEDAQAAIDNMNDGEMFGRSSHNAKDLRLFIWRDLHERVELLKFFLEHYAMQHENDHL